MAHIELTFEGICYSSFHGVKHEMVVDNQQPTSGEYFVITEGYLGDNCIQIFHLGRYIVGYTVGNFVLRRRVSGAVKRNFRTYIRRYTSPNENLNTVIPILMRFLTFEN